jgi:hypothetical protein
MANVWRELHTRALNHKGGDDTLFLNGWSNKIPNYQGGCKCRSFYITWKQINPPVFVNANTYFEWTVKLHNAVNTKLNKPQMTVENARILYS